MAISYKINVPDSAIERFRRKLADTDWPDQFDSPEQWNYGAPLQEVKELAEYWANHFDWRKAEAELNELPQYMTTVTADGFDPIQLHFVHQPSPVKHAIPLLFVHGWPGSFLEVKKILPLLHTGSTNAPAFHVVAPSLPNFGFSSAVRKPGFNLEKYAEVCHRLMLQLGYEQYVTQGGDWGFYITRAMGLVYPQHCVASHINLLRPQPPRFRQQPLLALQHRLTPYTARETAGFARSAWFAREGSGYNLLQRTKPQTVGYALADSPAALLAWLYEKLHDWTDAYPWTPAEVCTWVAVYAFSAAGPAASVRIYYESVHAPTPRLRHRDDVNRWIPQVKLGIAHFPRELSIVPSSWARTMGPVVFESFHDRGGHFAAWERPDAIAEDLRKMFGRSGPCFGVVQGRNGYAERTAKL